VEKKEKRRKLFPIPLCDFETLCDWTCFDTKWIWHGSARVFRPDFSNWKVLAHGQSLQTATRPPLYPPSAG
jgi:hypothetical protein